MDEERLMQVTIPTLLTIIALVFFCVEQAGAHGRSIAMWGAIILSVALLWGALVK